MKRFSARVAHRSARKLAVCLFGFIAAAPAGTAQSIHAQQSAPPTAGAAIGAEATASVAEKPPVIDGRDDDAIWKTATPITGFRVFDPKENGDPTFATEAKIGFDKQNLYVFTRMYDPHPDR